MTWLNKICIPVIIVIVFVSAKNIQWSGDHWKGIVKSDGKGYYAYLPAIFIYNDLNFSFFDSVEKKHPNPILFYDYRAECYGKTSNKYFVGTAVAIAPFFLIAHFTSSIFGFESDGYSKIYLIMISIAALFYLWLGLFYLKKLLCCYSSNQTLINLSLIVIVFSTNLYYYSVSEPSMSHIYSFSFITTFLFYSKKYFEKPSTGLIFILSILLGIIVLIRPVNGLIILALPFVSGDLKVFKTGMNFLLGKYSQLVLSIFIFVSIVSIQFFIYKIQTGHFFIDTYVGETFNWLSPHPIDFLFSYKKGLFVYTPILLICLFGLIILFKQNRYRFYSILFFLVVLIYVLSAWWSWWYGGSFGTRVIVEYYSIFVLLLLILMERINQSKLKFVLYSMLFIAIVVSQIQTYQYRYYHIHWEKMDKEHFWNSFLRIDLLTKKINPNQDLLN